MGKRPVAASLFLLALHPVSVCYCRNSVPSPVTYITCVAARRFGPTKPLALTGVAVLAAVPLNAVGGGERQSAGAAASRKSPRVLAAPVQQQ